MIIEQAIKIRTNDNLENMFDIESSTSLQNARQTQWGEQCKLAAWPANVRKTSIKRPTNVPGEHPYILSFPSDRIPSYM
jgi:hypothetical protein